MNFTLAATDYAEFQQKYITLVNDNPIDFLSEQKDRFAELLESIDEDKLDYRYAEGKWSLRELITHIVDTELIFSYRALATARGDKQNLNGFDHEGYIANANLENHNKEYLINYFTIARYNSLILFKGIADDQWENEIAITDYTMKLKAFPAMIAGHMEYHMQMIKDRYLQS